MWHQQRIGRVTASNFHTFRTKAQTILNRKGHSDKKPVYSSLVSSLLNKNDDVSHLPQINWGNAHEKDAIKSFMSDVASQHDGGPQGFKQCGLFVKPDYPSLAASPDGLFYCRCHGLSIIQANYPYLVRNDNLHVKETYDRVDFLEDFNGKPRLKRTHKYYTQMQAQMWVVDASHSWLFHCLEWRSNGITRIWKDSPLLTVVWCFGVSTVYLEYLPCIVLEGFFFHCVTLCFPGCRLIKEYSLLVPSNSTYLQQYFNLALRFPASPT